VKSVTGASLKASLASVWAVGALLGGALVSIPAQASAAGFDSSCYASAPIGFGASYFEDSGNDCAAPTTTTTATSSGSTNRWDTTGYVGISFSIGDGSFTPHLNLGLRETNVNNAGFVFGGEANMSLSLAHWLDDTQFRLLGLVGNSWVQGNGGIGWDVGKHAFILNAGVQAPYTRVFIDYALEAKTLRAFFELNSLSEIQAAQELTTMQTKITCGAGTLDTPQQILSTWANILGGPGDVMGDIFNGSIVAPPFGTRTFTGTPSTTAFANGKTCYTPGTPEPT
jgi:hypothetical protein